MNENLKALLQAASEDEELRAELTSIMVELQGADDEARPEVVSRVIALANERGFDLSEEDLVVEVAEDGQLEDAELAAVAGGCGMQKCGLTSSQQIYIKSPYPPRDSGIPFPY